jgi:hypothetical protein
MDGCANDLGSREVKVVAFAAVILPAQAEKTVCCRNEDEMN